MAVFCVEAQLTDFLERRYQKDPSIVYRQIAGEALLVPIRASAADLDSIYALDEVGAYIWELLDGQRLVKDIEALLLAEYDVEVDQARADIQEFLHQLEEIGAVRAA